MANKLYIRKIAETRTYYETAVSYAPRGIGYAEVTRREIPRTAQVHILEDWREATEPEAVIAGFEGNLSESEPIDYDRIAKGDLED